MAADWAKEQRYRLGLDLGTSSIGWAILRLDAHNRPDYLVRLGVRIFSDSRNQKDGTSLAAHRRLARQQRRRRDRVLRRKKRLIADLIAAGLWPSTDEARRTLKELNPYHLRAEGLDRPLKPEELGRAIFHLNQRRGFRSNRRTDRSADAEKGITKAGIAALRAELERSQARTLGEYLFGRWKQGLGTRARRFGEGAKARYDFYVDRELVAAEFDALWAAQQAHHPNLLTEQARLRIRDTLLYQRPLKPVVPGRCSLEPDEPRALLALPTVQRFRILQEVNNLRFLDPYTFQETSLSEEGRQTLLRELLRGKMLKFDRMRRLLKLPPGARFNLESERRKGLLGDVTTAQLAKDGRFGARWYDMPPEEQDAIVSMLSDDKLTDDQVLERLQQSYGMTAECAADVLAVNLLDGYGRLSLKAINRLMPGLERGLTYDKAVREAGYDTTDSSRDGSLPELPYYGVVLQRHVAFGTGAPEDPEEKRYGRIANPSVHVALNQLRKVVNAIIGRYGKPHQIVIELTREMKVGWKRAREIEREQEERQRENEKLRDELTLLGYPDTRDNLLRLRLFRELAGAAGASTRCIYTGEQITLTQLFSPEIEVDHILPYRRTFDDSIANKILVKARANRFKGDQTPYEAFSHSPDGYDWQGIQERTAALPRKRIKRFSAEAMKPFQQGEQFIDRQLRDTAYMTRLAREYLTAVCDPKQVWCANGSLIALVRGKWGLNKLLSEDGSKNRLDHRHHAIDATVIACMDRSLIQRIATAAAEMESRDGSRLIGTLEHPWPSFLPGLQNALARVVISHRPDHNPRDALHNDTAYGAREGEPSNGSASRMTVHSYVPLSGIADSKPQDVLEHLADRRHAQGIAALLEQHAADRAARRAAVEEYGKTHGIRRLRWVENLAVIPIADRRTGKPYKYVKGDGNYCYEIWADEKGKWTGDIVSVFSANTREFSQFAADKERYRREASNGKPLIMRLVVNDMVAVGEGSARLIYRVQKMSKGRIVLSHHVAAGDPTRNKLHIPGVQTVMTVAPSALQGANARRVFVDVLGRVFDPRCNDARPNSGAGGG